MPALGDGQARALLEVPPADTLKGKRDRAILATFLHNGLRYEELCGPWVRDLRSRQGVPHLRIFGKGAKVRYVPAHPLALERIHDYLIDGKSFGPHALRATAATNALDRGANLGKVQEWLGHANVSTTRLYDRRAPASRRAAI